MATIIFPLTIWYEIVKRLNNAVDVTHVSLVCKQLYRVFRRYAIHVQQDYALWQEYASYITGPYGPMGPIIGPTGTMGAQSALEQTIARRKPFRID